MALRSCSIVSPRTGACVAVGGNAVSVEVGGMVVSVNVGGMTVSVNVAVAGRMVSLGVGEMGVGLAGFCACGCGGAGNTCNGWRGRDDVGGNAG